MEPVTEILNKSRKWCSEKMQFIHLYPSGVIRKTVGYLMGKVSSPRSRAGMSGFSAELEAGIGSAFLEQGG